MHKNIDFILKKLENSYKIGNHIVCMECRKYKEEEMNNMRKIIALLLSLAMIVATIGIVGAKEGENATATNWKVSAVVTPAEGRLVGAGYINIKINTSLEKANSYKVYFDDELVETLTNNGSMQQIVEVYTTSISSHTAYVTAILEDNSEVQSDIRKFFVSKKGVALGSDMSQTVELKKMNMAWYYNWKAEAFNDHRDDQVEHVPMIWGRNQDDPNGTVNDNLYKYIKEQCDLVSKDANYVLGYNEPDLPAQANMSVVQAQEGWKSIEKLGKRTVSPAISNPNGTYSAWLTPFLKGGEVYSNGVQVTVEGISCDCVAIHTYISQRSVGQVVNAVKKVHELYNKPVWVTEMGIFGSKAYGDKFDYSYEKEGENEKTGAFIKEVCAQLDELDYVERYAWFPYDIHSANDIDDNDASGSTALFDYKSGKLTENGFLYATLGLPEDYPQTKLTEEDRYIYQEPETTKPETTRPETTKPETVTNKLQTTSKVVSIPGTVRINTVKNVKKKSVKLTWKKVKNAKKYQVQYSLKKNFKKAIIKTTKKVSYTIKKLKKKKKYYFRVRAINGNEKGKWSQVKSIKIKK